MSARGDVRRAEDPVVEIAGETRQLEAAPDLVVTAARRDAGSNAEPGNGVERLDNAIDRPQLGRMASIGAMPLTPI